MKKLILAVALLFCVGCKPDLTQSQDNTAPAPIQVNNRVGSYDLHYKGVEQITYNKHDYLVFSVGNDHGLQVCVVHDPDCKCHKTPVVVVDEDEF